VDEVEQAACRGPVLHDVLPDQRRSIRAFELAPMTLGAIGLERSFTGGGLISCEPARLGRGDSHRGQHRDGC
jgi:hypothetical protein